MSEAEPYYVKAEEVQGNGTYDNGAAPQATAYAVATPSAGVIAQPYQGVPVRNQPQFGQPVTTVPSGVASGYPSQPFPDGQQLPPGGYPYGAAGGGVIIAVHGEGSPIVQEMPSSHCCLAWFSCLLCCVPVGLIAVICSCMVSQHYSAGDFERALHASHQAKIWSYLSIVLGIVSSALFFYEEDSINDSGDGSGNDGNRG